MKTIFFAVLGTYLFFFATDWFWAYRHADRKFCSQIMLQPAVVWLAPGLTDGCIDKGFWP